jgi:amidohydrolase family protein
MTAIDVHQHLWPPTLLDALRRRTEAPMLRGWTLHTAGETEFDVPPADHDPGARAALDAGAAQVLVSLSSPLGIEALPPDEAQPLLDAWHDGAADLPQPFGAWAAVGNLEPDLDGLKGLLTGGFAGLQVPAGLLADPRGVEAAAPVLRLCEELDRPVLVHPGPASTPSGAPAWWAPVVGYVAQLQASWWAWHAVGRQLLPRLRICFAGGAGLAPVQHERLVARGGGRFVVDHQVFVDTSSYGRQGVDGLTRALGIDVVVLGSDRPYAAPPDPHSAFGGAAAAHAITVSNPRRLLEGGTV